MPADASAEVLMLHLKRLATEERLCPFAPQAQGRFPTEQRRGRSPQAPIDGEIWFPSLQIAGAA